MSATPSTYIALRASAWESFGASLACDFGLDNFYSFRPFSDDFFSVGFALNYSGQSDESYYFNYAQRESDNYCIFQPRIAYNLVLGSNNRFHIYAGPMAGIGFNYHIYDFHCEGMAINEHQPDYRLCASAGAFAGFRYLIDRWGFNLEVGSSKLMNHIHLGAFLKF